MVLKRKTEWLYGYPVVLSVSVVYRVIADGEPRLLAAARDHKKGVSVAYH